MDKITLYLIPNFLGESSSDVFSPLVLKIAPSLSYFAVENLKIARRFLRKLDKTFDIDGSHFLELRKESEIQEQLEFINEAIANKKNIGLLSDAGMPGIADPGEDFVMLAHQLNVIVKPLIGPNSILMALVASGLNAEKFEFVGYLPIKENERKKAIKQIESDSLKTGKSIIFMETPYRNNQLIASLIQHCNKDTLLCIASNISLAKENIQTKTIQKWKSLKRDLNKQPAIFIIQA